MKTNYHPQYKNKRYFSRILLVLLALSIVLGVFSSAGLLTRMSKNIYTHTNGGIRGIENVAAGVFTTFTPKYVFVKENQTLLSKLQKIQIKQKYTTALEVENTELRKLLTANSLSLTNKTEQVLARVIGYSDVPYGTLLLSTKSTHHNLQHGDMTYFGDWAVGPLTKITNTTMLVDLLTASGNTYDVLIGNTLGVFIGSGNGAGEILLPRDVQVVLGTPVILPSANGRILGIVEEIVRSDEEALQKILVRTPHNIHSLRFLSITTSQ